MKKVFLSLILISLLAVSTVPAMVLAQPVESCILKHDLSDFDPVCVEGEISEDDTGAWGMCCMLDAIYTVTIFGAFDILTAAGDPEKLKKGRERIMWAMVGLAVALLSRAIPSLVEAIIGT